MAMVRSNRQLNMFAGLCMAVLHFFYQNFYNTNHIDIAFKKCFFLKVEATVANNIPQMHKMDVRSQFGSNFCKVVKMSNA
ncbi:hypothetical protein L21SP4_01995 [Kiritimatiella glycovorans]|uniref:Uncharacterized protein n=1 Tax=Kiritimatiella glycovorans TaxID=1307763 RepID=A0A0G3EM38_9BACT|nr:hypothetical protein L21SP4_01995 [Kiritimatiella glycovorans]